MVDSSWKEGDPIKVILSFNELSDDEYSQVLESNNFTGVIRNVAWEGIENKQTDFLKKTYNLNFPDKPVLVQITNEKHNDEWVIFVMGLVIVILIIVFIIVAVKRNRSR
jgi:nitric oxide reductase large subunit